MRGSLMVAASVAVVAAAIIVFAPRTLYSQQNAHFADAGDDGVVLRGKQVYSHNCASCHGRALQEQPLWQLIDGYAGRWAPNLPPTYMPPFEHRLEDEDVLAAVAFIKRSWPLGLRVSQAMLNPVQAGMPAHAEALEWRLPPTTCRGSAIVRGP